MSKKRHPDGVHADELSSDQQVMPVIPMYWTLTAKQQDIVNDQMMVWAKQLKSGTDPKDLKFEYTPYPEKEEPVSLEDLDEDYLNDMGVHIEDEDDDADEEA